MAEKDDDRREGGREGEEPNPSKTSLQIATPAASQVLNESYKKYDKSVEKLQTSHLFYTKDQKIGVRNTG